MSQEYEDRLYNLLPAIHRARDIDNGYVLQALLRTFEEQLIDMEDDIAGLYADLFIETCSDWVIPYIGDTLGVSILHQLSTEGLNMRAFVANTIAYRRRKGTTAVIEQVARDVTGWPAHAVEFYQQLAWTQHINHPRVGRGGTADLSDSSIEWVGGPFETSAHTVDVRPISTLEGKYNIPYMGLFLWRLQSYPLTRICPYKVVEKDTAVGYIFDPANVDRDGEIKDEPLFNQPVAEEDIVHLATEINVPGTLRRWPLYDEIEALASSEDPDTDFFNEDHPVFKIYLDNEAVDPTSIIISDLTCWKFPDTTRSIAVDPQLGRFMISSTALENTDGSEKDVLVDFSYGFSADIGAGPWDRTEYVDDALTGDIGLFIGVKTDPDIPSEAYNNDEDISDETFQKNHIICSSIGDALQQFEDYVTDNSDESDKVAIIVVMDSMTYTEDITIKVPADWQLLLFAATCPESDDKCILENYHASDVRPILKGSIYLQSPDPTEDTDELDYGNLFISGLIVTGKLVVQAAVMDELNLSGCTLVPEGNVSNISGGIRIDSDYVSKINTLIVNRCICGPICLKENVTELELSNSIVDPMPTEDKERLGEVTLYGEQTTATIDACTILGQVQLKNIDVASNTIFTGLVTIKYQQTGCIRFCYLPYDSKTPRRYQCQPDTAINDLDSTETDDSSDIVALSEEDLIERIKPNFTSLTFGDPGYVQLSPRCADEIMTTGEDGSEMGVFNLLLQPQRKANLSAALEEYLPVGFELGIFYVN